MRIGDIYQELFAGNIIELDFDSDTEAESFRTQLYRLKKSQEDHMISIGMLVEADRRVLNIKTTTYKDHITLRIQFKDKRAQRDYAIRIIDPSSIPAVPD